MATRYYIGIDPGKHGGIAVMRGTELIVYLKMPPTVQDVWNFLRAYSDEDVFVLLERVSGRSGQSATAAFRFGQNFGNLEMAVTAAGLPFLTITPQKWQKYYQLGTCSQCAGGKTEWKNKLKACAQALFPLAHITLMTSDAILIANYATFHY